MNGWPDTLFLELELSMSILSILYATYYTGMLVMGVMILAHAIRRFRDA